MQGGEGSIWGAAGDSSWSRNRRVGGCVVWCGVVRYGECCACAWIRRLPALVRARPVSGPSPAQAELVSNCPRGTIGFPARRTCRLAAVRGFASRSLRHVRPGDQAIAAWSLLEERDRQAQRVRHVCSHSQSLFPMQVLDGRAQFRVAVAPHLRIRRVRRRIVSPARTVLPMYPREMLELTGQ